MPRKNKRRDDPAPVPPGSTRHEYVEGDFRVRHLTGETSTKTYRCPGCDQEIPPGVAHVVAWPLEGYGDGERRHWHASCWKARHHRRPSR
ncbi:MAG TPA: hypothetical protein VF062_06270 [Candidatus Limnocylindrales bacterium]